jgi:hypothetical protein
VADLPGPIEFLELAPGESRELAIARAEEGTTTIANTTDRIPKSIPVLRVHLVAGSKVAGLPYYDISSKRLQAQLAPVVLNPAALPRTVTVTKVGSGLGAQFQVDIAPMQASPAA